MMKQYLKSIIISLMFASLVFGALPELDESFGPARAWTQGDHLAVSTGGAACEFQWTGRGFVTVGLKDVSSSQIWGDDDLKSPDANWDFPGLTEGDAKLLSLSASASSDEGFTSEHLEVVAEIEYPQTGVLLKYVIWAYPGAPGLRTQIWLKGEPREDQAPTSTGNGVALAAVSGNPHETPASSKEAKVGKSYQLTNFFHPHEVELKLEGMSHDRDYKVMVSWWDTGAHTRRVQSIDALSMDGESRVTAVNPTQLPSWRDGHMPSTVAFDIPDSVRIGDTVRLKVKKKTGVNATLSEMWVYEDGSAPAGFELAGDPERISELKKKAPQGYYLADYLNLGAKPASVGGNAAKVSNRRVDYLPVADGKMTAFGYFNDTQHRHTVDHHMSREEVVEGDQVDWASVLFFESAKGGIAWVKESHKCVNRSGVDTGEFVLAEDGLHNTGSGLSSEYLSANEYRWAWATWIVLYPNATQDARELAMKQFDRARFPVDAERDVWVKANTWGSGNGGRDSMSRAAEQEVLRELDSVSDLGIDVLQIDDGWQKGRSEDADKKTNEWRTRDDWYPNGWSTVKQYAKQKNVRLGLWTAARADIEDLKLNFDEGGFETWKYDFAHIANYEHLYHHWSKLRNFLLYTDHKARMAVDVTENAPRFGYFWARDFGCVWLSNRKPNSPANTIPQPTLMLRENRELSEYVNLNKFELPIQNFARVNKQKSDAHLYGHGYEVALGLMGIPTFFQSTYHYEGAERDEVRALLDAYKPVQEDLYERFVFAIGDEPNGAAWSGFQWVNPDSDVGYLLIFRERESTNAAEEIALRFLKAGKTLKLKDLCTQKSWKVKLSSESSLLLNISEAADFAFLKYEY